MSDPPPDGPDGDAPSGKEAARDRDPVLPRSPDENDVGWGEREDDDDRLRREVPPHWGRD